MLQQILSLSLVAVFSFCFAAQLKEVTEENCEVCVKIINKFTATLDEKTRSDYQKVENAFKKFCKTANHDDNRFCYYVGGLEESATTMLGELSKPISFFMPAEKICLKLYRRDAQICDLKYEKSFDLSKVNFDKLKVADLKNILSNWGEVCRGCSEKSEYIALVKELLPKYAPEVASAREL